MATKAEIRDELARLGAELPPERANVKEHEKALRDAKRDQGANDTAGGEGDTAHSAGTQPEQPQPSGQATEPGPQGGVSATPAARQRARDEGNETDLALTPQHPESRVEPLPIEEKAGPGSLQSREIRPDERPEAVGKTALAASDEDAANAEREAAVERGSIPE